MRGYVADHERIAVRMRARGHLRRDGAAGTRLVIDDEALAHGDAQLVGDDPRHQIDATARRLRSDYLDRTIRVIVLRDGVTGDSAKEACNGDCAAAQSAWSHTQCRNAQAEPDQRCMTARGAGRCP